jgi:hypothetical protein
LKNFLPLLLEGANNRIRRIDNIRDGNGTPRMSSGNSGSHRLSVTTIMGTGEGECFDQIAGVKGYKDGPALGSTCNCPSGLLLNASESCIFFSDENNQRIRKIDFWTLKSNLSYQLKSIVPPKHLDSLLIHYENMLNKYSMSDMDLYVTKEEGGGAIHVSSHILTGRSEYFKNMLNGQFKEGLDTTNAAIADTTTTANHTGRRSIHIPDTTYEALYEVCRFLYCSRCILTSTNTIDILLLSSKFLLIDLIDLIVIEMVKAIDLQNCMSFLHISDCLVLNKLKESVLLYIRDMKNENGDRYATLITSSEYRQLDHNLKNQISSFEKL